MAYRETGGMDLLVEQVNDNRSNIISALSTLYKKLASGAVQQEYVYEKFKIVYQNGTLEVLGCVDSVKVTGPKYSDVHLGEMISNNGHVPYSWIEDFIC